MKNTEQLLSHEFKNPFSKLKSSSPKHKDWYGKEFAQIYFSELEKAGALFTARVLTKKYVELYKKMEMKERFILLAEILRDNLSRTSSQNYKVFKNFLGKPWPLEEGMMTYAFYLYPLSQLLEMDSIYHNKAGLIFLEQMTQRFTGEFAIRPHLIKDPKGTLEQMKVWSKHKSFHVRRLSSEGLRIRLPWGQGVPWLKTQPQKTLPIFSRLRNDPSLYVRRSVANAMGDLIKVQPDLALKTFNEWLAKKHTKDNLWVIRHGVRHPCKKGMAPFVELKEKVENLRKELR